MLKNCSNCYYKCDDEKWCIVDEKEPIEKICDYHIFVCQECKEEPSSCIHKEKHYCHECILKEFEVEEATIKHYYLNGEHLGTDEDIEEVLRNLDCEIEILWR